MGCQIMCGKHSINSTDVSWCVMKNVRNYFTPEEYNKAHGNPCHPGDEYYAVIPKEALKRFRDANNLDSIKLLTHDYKGRRTLNEEDAEQIWRFICDAVNSDEDVSCSY